MLDKNDLVEIKKLLSPIKIKLDQHTEILNSHSEKLESHSASLMKIEKEIGIYSDSLDVERTRIDRIEKELEFGT